MLILVILLGVLMVGIVCFVAGQCWEQNRKKQAGDELLFMDDLQGRTRGRIKEDLDRLVVLHHEGQLSDEQLLLLSDELIDELAALGTADVLTTAAKVAR
ncbi:hypothetical protein DYU11_28580 [Fibrisoma montanum]|uniref:Uncharacterized protein n=1 Tax=Fibrisoma montanum TaxID=2305895 RepID=A0A418LZ81_9BACT|nr:hypothetical protein [Fibrisoma montanum]RIV18531.1 hypothetical protein DYU11_28580 [Fibrisoma montanum]